jgi:hypothetical protein
MPSTRSTGSTPDGRAFFTPDSGLTLDQFARSRGISEIGLLKVDVEGYEPEVFLGATGLLRRRAIKVLVFEFSPRVL